MLERGCPRGVYLLPRVFPLIAYSDRRGDMKHLARLQMRGSWRGLLWLLLVCTGLVLPSAAAAPRVNWETLFAGDVLVDVVHRADGVAGLRSLFTVAASRERIWSVLLDYDNFPQIFHGVKRLKVLESDKHRARVEYWIDAILATYHYIALREYPEPGHKVTWMRLSGDFKRLEGSWEIQETPRPGVHMLAYESYMEVDSIIPEALIRLEAIRRTREMGEHLRRWIEKRPLRDAPDADHSSAEIPGAGY